MAEFWPEKTSESSAAKVVKPASSANIVSTGSQPTGDDPPTVLSSFKPSSAIIGEPSSSIARELAGEMLAHFRLDDYIGVGGMGAVFRATDIRLDRPVALKILPPEQAKEPEIVSRFQHEARAAARLDHENIARVYFIGEDRGLHFIAFEFVDGVNVRELIQQCGPLSPQEVVNYALQITGALVHAVTRSVVHRDIKPSNIIITSSGRAKLVDMGLARNFERRQDGGITQSGITLGTFDYISPEQARDPRTADIRSDIYSLGCTLFHMLTGRPPFPEGTLLQKLLKHQEEAPPDPRAFNPRIPADLAEAVMRMMAKEPSERRQTPQELLAEFLEIAARMGLKSSSPEGLIWVFDQPGSSMTKATWAIWLTAAAALVISVAGLSFWPGQQPGSQTASRGPTQIDARIEGDLSAKRGEASTGLVEKPSEPTQSIVAPVSSGQEFTPQQSAATPKPPESKAEANTDTDAPAGVISVAPDQDLRKVVDQAPSGSIIEISGDYRPQSKHLVDDLAGVRVEDKRLTIRAAPGTRPRITLNYDDQDFGVTDWSLFDLVGSQLELEGIHFEVGSEKPGNPPMIVLALQSSQATLRRCTFLQVGDRAKADLSGREGEPHTCIARLSSGIDTGGEVVTSSLVARECFFGGGDRAFQLEGPAKLDLTDCLLLPYRCTVLIRSPGYAESQFAEVRMSNVSIFGSGEPIVDLIFANASIHSQAVVFSHEVQGTGILARVDADSKLRWRGKNNLYHNVRQFLVSRVGAVPLARGLEDWTDLSHAVEDTDSEETERSPWTITLSEAASRSVEDVANAFRVAHDAVDSNWNQIGSRFVLPWGPLYQIAQTDPLPLRSRTPALPGGFSPQTQAANASQLQPAVEPRTENPTKSDTTAGTGDTTADAGAASGVRLDVKKLMNTNQSREVSAPTGETAGGGSRPGPVSGSNPPQPPDASVVDLQSDKIFPSLAAACARAEDGAVLEIRQAGVLRESVIELGNKHITIRGASGFRPTIEFTPTASDLRGQPRIFDIRQGSLTLRDLDIRMVIDPTISAEMWSVVASRSADVQFEGCTVTVQGPPGPGSAVVRLYPADVDDPMIATTAETGIARPQIQLRNAMIVGVANLVKIQPAVRCRVEVENCAIDVQHSLFTVSGGMDRSQFAAVSELDIRRSTIRTGRTLVSYEANESRAWLPRLEVSAADNLFVGDASSAWLRFKSPRSADEQRGLLKWKGMNNSYDGVEIFWELESMASGEIERVGWDQWLRSPARDEIKAERGRMEFLIASDPTQPWLLTRNHFKPSPSRMTSEMSSDGGARGADLTLIPAPPQDRQAQEKPVDR